MAVTPDPLADLADLAGLVGVAQADADVVRLLTDVLADRRAGGPRAVDGVTVDLDADLWSRLDGLGLTLLASPESAGGSGATWRELSALLGLAAGAAAPVPLAEHQLAAWLLERAGLPHDGALRVVARVDGGGSDRPGHSGRTAPTAHRVAWASAVTSVVALVRVDGRCRVADVPVTDLTVSPGRDLAGQPCDTVRFAAADLAEGVVVDASVAQRLHLLEALVRCAQVVGAMERVLELVLTHARQREQFGRPIGRFQAVQHLVADVAMETALARAATDAAVASACDAADHDGGRAGLDGRDDTGADDRRLEVDVAVAASCVGHASSVVVRAAHQVLGAMGTTAEHELHRLTRPVLVWRNGAGPVHEWDRRLTRLAAAAGRDGLWPLVTTDGPAPRPQPDGEDRHE
ncbi:acyl-CoA dehydrogenase family protein [Terracoccus luteus]|uniref:Acyl-CoA dehydrogenase n=1 Tax=Terracoccus luteus TaxID=53356 RepID=A0A839Q5M7_9MICO|nr:acyl-CoA dehydrogenase family protein [Terracoccus luteus]MBB2987921.1 acyl-CoA dehydrogenase [Terracoccus luteus]MCP2173572.1 acyl-CoA dehydrogenase [Terracoccus luteus]